MNLLCIYLDFFFFVCVYDMASLKVHLKMNWQTKWNVKLSYQLLRFVYIDADTHMVVYLCTTDERFLFHDKMSSSDSLVLWALFRHLHTNVSISAFQLYDTNMTIFFLCFLRFNPFAFWISLLYDLSNLMFLSPDYRNRIFFKIFNKAFYKIGLINESCSLFMVLFEFHWCLCFSAVHSGLVSHHYC